MNYDDINNALTNHFSILWTDEARQDIIDNFGKETYSFVTKIVAEGGNSHIWGENNPEFSHKQTILDLKKEYPFLTRASLIKAADSAAYFWKQDS